MLTVKRVYDNADASDGFRILVDRLWPRGLKKDAAAIDKWAKEIAPSTQLRKEFHQHAEKWAEFRKQYLAELESNNFLPELKAAIENHKTVTLLYASRDEQHNHAVILKSFLEGNYK